MQYNWLKPFRLWTSAQRTLPMTIVSTAMGVKAEKVDVAAKEAAAVATDEAVMLEPKPTTLGTTTYL